MRGRRRGRNRPSPPSPSAVQSGSSDAPSGQGSVTLVEDDHVSVVEGAEAGVIGEPVTDSPAVSDLSAPDSPATPEDTARAPRPEQSPEPPVEPAAAVTDKAEPADASVDDAEVGVTEATEPPGVESDADDAAPSAAPAPEAVDPARAAPVREVQAASGNPLPRVLAVANQKGGVGKTTTSVNLGAALAELGFRVLVIDLDPQGNATTGLGIDARNFELSMYDVLMRDCSLEDCVEPTSMKNLFVAPATIALAGAEIELVPAFSRELKLKRAIESVIDDFDYVLIDCPPSLGLITVNALAAATEVLVPIQCEYYALEGLSQLMRNVHLVASNLNPRLDISTIVLTMYDARTKLADQVATEVREHFGSKVCRIVIPRTVRLSEAPSFGQPITAFDPASRGAIAYRELAKEVSGGTS